MLIYTLRRVVLFFPVLLAILFITFTFGFYAPGDPLEIQFGEDYVLDEEVLARLRKLYGLDRPFWVQFGDYVWKLAQGDMGEPLRVGRGKQSIGEMVWEAFPISAQIGVAAGFLLIVIGIPLGTLAASKQNTWIDYIIVTGSIVGSSIHVIVLAPLMMVITVLWLPDLLELLGITWNNRIPIGWHGLFSTRTILPISILVVTGLLGIVRLTRAGVLEVIRQNYVRTARAKGLFEQRVVSKHMLKNSLTPVLTSMGLTLSGLVTGAVFIERIFAIPGFAGMGINAFQSRDYPVILATTMIGATIIILANLLVDLGYGLLDPRVRYE